jgi:large repetitive protein
MWRSLFLFSALVSSLVAQTPPADAFQVGSVSGLNAGDVLVNLTTPKNNVCVNTYVFSGSQLTACCSSLITPNATWGYSAHNLFSGNSGTVKLLATAPANTGSGPTSCRADLQTGGNLVTGLGASFTVPAGSGANALPFQNSALPPDLSTLSGACHALMASAGAGLVNHICASATVQQTASDLTITTSTLPSTVAGQQYSAPLAAAGGHPPYTWSVISGAPAGFTLTPGTGVLATIGTPPALAGTYWLNVMVMDSQQAIYTRLLSLTVAPGGFVCPTAVGQTSITQFQIPAAASQPLGIVAGRDGVWFVEFSANKIARITAAGTITEFALPTANSQPVGIAIGVDGNPWFTASTDNKIGTIASDTGTITEFSIPTANSQPQGIAVDAAGVLWFTESAANKIGKLSGGIFTETAIPTPNSQPFGIVAGPDGNIWFTEKAAGKIGRLTSAGLFTEFALAAGSQPYGITAGPDGNLWFVEAGSNKIGQITPGGVVTEFVIPTANSDSRGIVAGPDGNIWFTESAGNKLGRVTTGGLFTEAAIPTFGSAPNGITVSADGNLWFTEANGNAIARGQTSCNPPSSILISATGGGGQSAVVNTAFASPLIVTATDTGSHPVSGVPVTFTVPNSGASGAFAGASVATATTGSNGQAVSPAVAANGTSGAFTAHASAPGAVALANYGLTNTLGASAVANKILASSGGNQHAAINTGFSSPLVVAVQDALGSPVAGVTVTFAAPINGPSALFGALPAATTVTGANGLATSFIPTANGSVGQYSVVASVAGLASTASFTLSNTFVISEYSVNGASGPYQGITAGPDGNLWFGRPFNIGQSTTVGVPTLFPLPTYNANFGQGSGIALGSDGNLWLADHDAIYRITPAGSPTSFSLGPNHQAQGITAGPDGNLWFTDYLGSQIGRITTSGGITFFPIPGAGPWGIVKGPDSALWFTEFGADKIGRITTSGVVAEFALPSACAGAPGRAFGCGPLEIASGPDGNLWFTETNGSKIGTITTAGAITEYFVGVFPVGIAAGPDGNLWFTDSDGDVAQITLAGVPTIPHSSTAGVPFSAEEITTGPDGNLWFTEFAKIGKLNLHPSTIAITAPVSLPAGTLGTAYPLTSMTASGGTGGYSFAATGLPPGLSMSTIGVITGTPTAVNGSPFTVQVTVADTSSNTAARNYQLPVNVAITIAPNAPALPSGTIGAPYPSTPVTATGGIGNYTFTATGLPSGLTMSSSGLITGTLPTNAGGTYTVQVSVLDSSSNTASRGYQLSVNAFLTIIGPASLPVGTVRSPYPPTTVTAAAGTGGYTFAATGLPPGMGMSVNGTILGTPSTNAGSPYTVQVFVTDTSLSTASKTYQLTINGPLTVSPSPLPAGTVNLAYPITTLTAAGGAGGYTFAVTNLPPGLTMSSAGVISGTPTSNSGSPFSLHVTVTDSSSNSANATLPLTINAALAISGSLPNGTEGTNYPASSLSGTGGSGGYSFSATGLPPGLTISTSGLVSGKPTTSIGSPFTAQVTVTDSSTNTATRNFQISIIPALLVSSPASLPIGVLGFAYPTTTLIATGGSGGGYSFQSSGLPAGLTMSSAGVITGTPTTNSGSPYNVFIAVLDSSFTTANRNFQLTINGSVTISGPVSLPVGVTNATYTPTAVTAAGGSGGYSFTAIGLPPGLTMSAAGLITGTPTDLTGSPYTVQITVTDTNSSTASANFQILVVPAGTPTITAPANLRAGTAGAAYPLTIFTTAGGAGGYKYSATGLPPGLSLSAGGFITGTPASNIGSPYTITVTVTDNIQNTGSRTYQLTINLALAIIAPASLPSVAAGTAYPATTVTATGGSGEYSFTATGLPPGLNISSGGVITGTPASTAGNPFTVQVTVSDSNSTTASATYQLVVIGPLLISGPQSLPTGMAGSTYPSTTVTATGGTGPYSFTASGLPAGLGISSGGIITGTPSSAIGSPFTVQFTVADSTFKTASASYQLTILPTLMIVSPASLPTGTVASPYPSTTLTATGGSGGGYSFTSTSLPPGLSISTAGVITGTPSSNNLSPYNVQVTVTDSNSSTANRTYLLTVNGGVAIAGPASLPAGAVGASYPATTISAKGGVGGYTFTVNGLPPGLTMSTAGVISGTPTTTSGSPFTVQVTVIDTNSKTAVANYQLVVNPSLTISTPASLPTGTVNVNYLATTITATGGGGGYTFAAAGLPPGLTLSPNGLLTGTPSSSSGSPFTVQVTVADSGSNTAGKTYQLTINQALAITAPASLPAGVVTVVYPSVTLTAAGGSGGYFFSATGLPPGLTLSPGGVLSGTPISNSGSPYSVTITVIDTVSTTASRAYQLSVNLGGTLSISTPAVLPAGTVNVAYPASTVTATGGTGGYSFAASGMPPGLTISSAGVITGTPTSNSGSPFTTQVTVTDNSSNTANKGYQIVINAALTISGPASLPTGAVGIAYPAATVTATGGTGGYTFSATGLPPGLTMSFGGVLSGTPISNSGSPYSVQVTVMDSSTNTAVRSYQLAISPLLSISAPASLPGSSIGTSYLATITAVGGAGGYNFTATGLPPGLAITSAGVISGTPTTNTGSPFTVQVTVTDSSSNTAGRSYQIAVSSLFIVTNPAGSLLPEATAGVLYPPVTASAVGGSGGYTFSATGLPLGLAISPGGTIAGTPDSSAGGTYTVQISVIDSTSSTASRTYQLVVDRVLTITGPPSLPAGTYRVAYPPTTITVAAGTGGYSFMAQGLPPGMGISNTGIIVGTPSTNIGSPFNVTIWVTDSSLAIATKTYQLTINGPLIISGPGALPVGMVNSPYPATTVTAAGGSGGFSFNATGMPPGLSISSGGVISGTPTANDGSPYLIHVTVTDSASSTGGTLFQLIVNSALAVTAPASLPTGTLDVAYPGTQLSASGGAGGYTFTATGLPPGLALSMNGLISGTPSSAVGSPFNVQVTVTDFASATATRSYMLVVGAPLAVAGPAALPTGTLGLAYPSTTIIASGGSGGYHFSATGLPPGLTLSTAGVISGSPVNSTGSPYSVLITISDSSLATAARTYQLTILGSLTIINPASLPNGTVNAPYPATTISANGGAGGYTFSASGLPAGLNLSPAGVLTGTPTSIAGSPFSVQVSVTDSSSNTANKTYQLAVNAATALSITAPASLPSGTVNTPYPATIVTATGGAGGYVFTASGLPSGLTISAGGVIGGTPSSSAGSPFSVQVMVTDSSSTQATRTYQIAVDGGGSGNLAITGPATLPTGTVRSPYPATTITASGGTGGYSFAATGLPAGIGISNGGVIIGTPQNNIGSPFTVQVYVTDSSSNLAVRTYQLAINALLSISGPASLPAGTVNAPYPATSITATGGSGGYSFAATGLPSGLSMSAAGVIVGTPTNAAGSPFTVQVTVTDSSSNTNTATYQFTVQAALAIAGPASLHSGAVNSPYSGVAITATGGTGSYSFTATGLPPGLTLSPNGILFGTPTSNSGSPYSVVIMVTDSGSSTASATYQITIF